MGGKLFAVVNKARKRSLFVRLVLALMAMMLLSGCATKYQASGLSGGFTETQLDANVFRVTFNGNASTPSERAADFALLRSAELTLQHGYRYFAVMDALSEVATSTYTTPKQTYTAASVNAYGSMAQGSAQTYTTGGQTYTAHKPSSTNTIVLLHGKPDNGMFAFDAQFVYMSITQKYGIKVNR